ncbi:hypothetical protein I547_3951 [Mycobacterium kansasii 824]|nr:hypothetical protein I547_3951 [Mycobacterium kansasii 824]
MPGLQGVDTVTNFVTAFATGQMQLTTVVQPGEAGGVGELGNGPGGILGNGGGGGVYAGGEGGTGGSPAG